MVTVEPTRSLAPDATAERPMLASGVRIRSTSAVDVRGPWSIGMVDGSHESRWTPGRAHPEDRLAHRTLSWSKATSASASSTPSRWFACIRGSQRGSMSRAIESRSASSTSSWDPRSHRSRAPLRPRPSSRERRSSSSRRATATRQSQPTASWSASTHRRARPAGVARPRAAVAGYHRDDEARCAYRLYLGVGPTARSEARSNPSSTGSGRDRPAAGSNQLDGSSSASELIRPRL